MFPGTSTLGVGVAGIAASGCTPTDWGCFPSIPALQQFVAGSIGRRLLQCLSYNIFSTLVIYSSFLSCCLLFVVMVCVRVTVCSQGCFLYCRNGVTSVGLVGIRQLALSQRHCLL